MINILEGLRVSDDDNSDAHLCKGWDKPHYISANHGNYPDNSCYECEADSSDDENCADDTCCHVYLEKIYTSRNKTEGDGLWDD
jgi:hypothetical protein